MLILKGNLQISDRFIKMQIVSRPTLDAVEVSMQPWTGRVSLICLSIRQNMGL